MKRFIRGISKAAPHIAKRKELRDAELALHSWLQKYYEDYKKSALGRPLPAGMTGDQIRRARAAVIDQIIRIFHRDSWDLIHDADTDLDLYTVVRALYSMVSTWSASQDFDHKDVLTIFILELDEQRKRLEALA